MCGCMSVLGCVWVYVGVHKGFGGVFRGLFRGFLNSFCKYCSNSVFSFKLSVLLRGRDINGFSI